MELKLSVIIQKSKNLKNYKDKKFESHKVGTFNGQRSAQDQLAI